MLTLEEFDSIEVGDQIEAGPLLPALSDEPLLLNTVLESEARDHKEFVVTWHGVTLGRWSCTNRKGVLKWQL